MAKPARQPHIHLTPKDACARAIVCGAPERAERIAQRLSQAREVAKNREYHSYRGRHNGKDLLVVSHGVGAAGAGICFQEMIDVGVSSIIRVGTAGGLRKESRIGDLVVATAAIRHDGLSRLMVPLEFPAIPDLDLTTALIKEARERQKRSRAGIVLTTDLFYRGLLEDQLKFYSGTNAMAVEMECASLFIIGQLRNVRTAAVVALDGNVLRKGHYDPRASQLRDALDVGIDAALEALTR